MSEIINGALVCLKKGAKLTDEERKAIADYIEFIRERARKKKKAAAIKALKPTEG